MTTKQAESFSSSSRGRQRQRRSRRAVRFPQKPAQVVGRVEALRDLTFEEIRDRYWVPEEMSTVRKSAKLATRDIRRQHPRGIELIDQVLDRTAEIEQEDEATTAFDDVMSDPTELATQWMKSKMGHGRGLEKYVSKKYLAMRADTIADARCTVVTEYAYVDGAELGSTAAEVHSDVERIARMYKEKSRIAMLQARIVGAADALVVDQHPVVVAEAPKDGAAVAAETKKKTTLVEPSVQHESPRPKLQRQPTSPVSVMDDPLLLSPAPRKPTETLNALMKNRGNALAKHPQLRRQDSPSVDGDDDGRKKILSPIRSLPPAMRCKSRCLKIQKELQDKVPADSPERRQKNDPSFSTNNLEISIDLTASFQ